MMRQIQILNTKNQFHFQLRQAKTLKPNSKFLSGYLPNVDLCILIQVFIISIKIHKLENVVFILNHWFCYV